MNGDVLGIGSIVGGIVSTGLHIWDASNYTPQEQAADATAQAASAATQAQAAAHAQEVASQAAAKTAQAKYAALGVGVLVLGFVVYKALA